EQGTLALPLELELLAARAVQDHLLGLAGQLLPRRVEVEAERAPDLREVIECQLAVDELAFVRERVQRAFAQRLGPVFDEQLGREAERLAEPVAVGARAARAVEREQTRLHLGQGAVAVRAAALRREQAVTLVAVAQRA